MIRLIIAAVAVATLGCNVLSRKYGGDMTEKLECNRKVINVTWKDDDFWVLTRPMRADDVPETYLFEEDSNLGIIEGSVTIVECKK